MKSQKHRGARAYAIAGHCLPNAKPVPVTIKILPTFATTYAQLSYLVELRATLWLLTQAKGYGVRDMRSEICRITGCDFDEVTSNPAQQATSTAALMDDLKTVMLKILADHQRAFPDHPGWKQPNPDDLTTAVLSYVAASEGVQS